MTEASNTTADENNEDLPSGTCVSGERTAVTAAMANVTATSSSTNNESMLFGKLFDESSVVTTSSNRTTKLNLTGATEIEMTRAAYAAASATTARTALKEEPATFLQLTSEIFELIDQQMVCSKNRFMCDYVKSNFGDQEMLILTTILKDLDRELSHQESMKWSNNSNLSTSFVLISERISRFMYNLITNTEFVEIVRKLFVNLGVSPFETNLEEPWPLQIQKRVLSALVQVVLTRASPEREVIVSNIWLRLIHTLRRNVTAEVSSKTIIFDNDNEDLNCEHMETLLLLFYSLNLMQKKTILLTVQSAIVLVAHRTPFCMSNNYRILQISRLLLIFDFLVKHLYEMPAHLMERVQANIRYSNENKQPTTTSSISKTVTFTAATDPKEWAKIERQYRKHQESANDLFPRPRFYQIARRDAEESTTHDAPKLDGLACNFILSSGAGSASGEKSSAYTSTSYTQLFESLISLLSVIDKFQANDLTFMGNCAVQYCFEICWQLLLNLPPSWLFLEQLSDDSYVPSGCHLLYFLIWGPRITSGSYNRWLKDHVVKQGMYAAQVAKLMKKVNERIENYSYKLRVVRECVLALTPTLSEPLTLFHCTLLDAVVNRLHFVWLWDENSLSRNDHSDTHNEILLLINRLIDTTLECTRQNLLLNVVTSLQNVIKVNKHVSLAYEILDGILYLPTKKNSLITNIGHDINEMLPICNNWILQEWDSEIEESVTSDDTYNTESSCNEPTTVSDNAAGTTIAVSKKSSASNVVASNTQLESRLLTVIRYHVTAPKNASLVPSIKHLLRSLLRLIHLYVTKLMFNSAQREFIASLLTSISLDIRCAFLYDLVKQIKDGIHFGVNEYENMAFSTILTKIYKIQTNYVSTFDNVIIHEKVLEYCLTYSLDILNNYNGLCALETFCATNPNWPKVYIYLAVNQSNYNFSVQLLRLFERVLDLPLIEPHLVTALQSLSTISQAKLQSWLFSVILGAENSANIMWDVPITAKLIEELERDSDSSTVTSSRQMVVDDESITSASIVSTNAAAPNSSSIDDSLDSNCEHLKNFVVLCLKQEDASFYELVVKIAKAVLPLSSLILMNDKTGDRFSNLLSTIVLLSEVCDREQFLETIGRDWLQSTKQQILQDKTSDAVTATSYQFETANSYLPFLSDLLQSISIETNEREHFRFISTRPNSPLEREISTDCDSDYLFDDANGEDDTAHDDSDTDRLSNKLCTFTLSQKEYMNQHWYHCHTCNMLHGFGVCSICARVCHKDHDLSYSKYGNFFCDCGAKGEGSCKALTKRTATNTSSVSGATVAISSAIGAASSSSRSASGSGSNIDDANNATDVISPRLYETPKKVAEIKTVLNSPEINKKFLTKRKSISIQNQTVNTSLNIYKQHLIEMLERLQPKYEELYLEHAPLNMMKRSVRDVCRAQILPKRLVFVNNGAGADSTKALMSPSLNVAEGTFENVRLQLSSEQNQTIRQLLNAHIIQKNGMCCLSSIFGKKQHVVFAHEKGKVYVLLLSSLLKMADVSKRKLPISARLATVHLPFTVLSLAENQCNDDYVAVCGARDCHVLSFATTLATSGTETTSATGSAQHHIVLHLQLETGNYILKAMWLPGSQTELAVLTSDFIKIYDLNVDITAPTYYFLLPSGKVRDCAFVFDETASKYFIMIMSSPGLVYWEMLSQTSSAKHGTFYVTNTIDVMTVTTPTSSSLSAEAATFMTSSTAAAGNGTNYSGISIYYSHTFGLLFTSFDHGKNYVGHLNTKTMTISNCMELELEKSSKGTSAGTTAAATSNTAIIANTTATTTTTNTNTTTTTTASTNTGTTNVKQSLFNWKEVANHPGLIVCLTRSSLSPVVIMIKPNEILIEELKISNSKTKVADVVTVRNKTGNDQRTTMLILCEDGSLKVFTARPETTGYWMRYLTTDLVLDSFCIGASKGRSSSSNSKHKKKRLLGSGSGVTDYKHNRPYSSEFGFPVDFFEHCTQMDVDFGGSDLLEFYSETQIKSRLLTHSMYVASTKSLGFHVEIINTNSNMYITGLRILLGTQGCNKVPSYIQIFEKFYEINLTHARWFDVPFSDEEILLAEKELVVFFGPSSNSEKVNMVDSILAYGKNKDHIVFADDVDERNQKHAFRIDTDDDIICDVSNDDDDEDARRLRKHFVDYDSFFRSALEILDWGFHLQKSGIFSISSQSDDLEAKAIEVARKILVNPSTHAVHLRAKSLISTVIANEKNYHRFKDNSLLEMALREINNMRYLIQENRLHEIDLNRFYRLLLIVCNVALNRPDNLADFINTKTHLDWNFFESNLDKNQKYVVYESQNFIAQIMEVFYYLYLAQPKKPELGMVFLPGLRNTQNIVFAFVEIVHNYMLTEPIYSNTTTKNALITLYFHLLLSDNRAIAFSARKAISKVLKTKDRKRKATSATAANTASAEVADVAESNAATASSQSAEKLGVIWEEPKVPQLVPFPRPEQNNENEIVANDDVENDRNINIVRVDDGEIEGVGDGDDNGGGGSGSGGNDPNVNIINDVMMPAPQADDDPNMFRLEMLLRDEENFPAFMDLESPNENDDEAMVEYAIALSLQEQELQSLENADNDEMMIDQEMDEEEGDDGNVGDGVGVNDAVVDAIAVPGAVEVEDEPSSSSAFADIVRRSSAPRSGSNVNENLSDSTTSATGSDDEGSTVATDGSTLRTSPAENVETSESGNSATAAVAAVSEGSVANAADEIGNQGAGGDADNINVDALSMFAEYDSGSESNVNALTSAITAASEAAQSTAPSLPITLLQNQDQLLPPPRSPQLDPEQKKCQELHALQMQILERMILYIPQLKLFNGERIIPFTQLLLFFVYELDTKAVYDNKVMEILVSSILSELKIDDFDEKSFEERSPLGEVRLVLIKFLSTLTTKLKKSSLCSTNSYITSKFAKILCQKDVITYCFKVLRGMVPYWKRISNDCHTAANTDYVLLKKKQITPPPDMHPIFIKSFLKEYPDDAFEMFADLVTEVAAALPYLIYRNSGSNLNSSKVFSEWPDLLCDYMTFSITLARKQVRKLLIHICGNKERYRQFRDSHLLNNNIDVVIECCKKGLYSESADKPFNIVLPYDSQVELVEYLRAILEVAVVRTENWQRFCLKNNATIPILVKISYLLDESVASIVLLLLQQAFTLRDTRSLPQSSSSTSNSKQSQTSTKKSSSSTPDEKGRKKIEPLADLLFRNVPGKVILAFIEKFLLETNTTMVRWQAHALLESIYNFAKPSDKDDLFLYMRSLWETVYSYGHKAKQFVDLLGFFALNHSKRESKAQEIENFIESITAMLKTQNKILEFHPNANLYSNLSYIAETNGFYLEPEPCLVCNNPEVTFANLKLATIRSDTKFTTTSHIVKLVGCYSISKIHMKITDLKKTKMIHIMNVYYNNHRVHASIELKNKPSLWHRAKRIYLTPGQNDVKIEFVLPITASNLMFEYVDFYENVLSSTDTLQCPRCNASVPSNPGVCSNCGENVFQCHKCRGINYDEKDPFLCHICGFCKYAKFDFVLTARPCCAIEPIENDEGRAKTESMVITLLEKADKTYSQLVNIKPSLEDLLLTLNENAAAVNSVTSNACWNMPNVSGTSSSTSNLSSGSTSDVPAQQITYLPSSGTTTNPIISVSTSNFQSIVAGLTSATNIATTNQTSNNNGLRSGPASTSAAAAVTPVANAASTTTGTSTAAVTTGTSHPHVNKTIQIITQKYCVECKQTFEELSKIIQRVLACRREISNYDKVQGHRVTQTIIANVNTATNTVPVSSSPLSMSSHASSEATPNTSSLSSTTSHRQQHLINSAAAIAALKQRNCYGCAIATTQHCLALLNGLLAFKENRNSSIDAELIPELVKCNLKCCRSLNQNAVNTLFVKLCYNNEKCTKHLFELLMRHVTLSMEAYRVSPYMTFDVQAEMSTLTNLTSKYDNCWEMKMRYIVQLFLKTTTLQKYPLIMTSITLPCLQIVQNTIKQKSFLTSSSSSSSSQTTKSVHTSKSPSCIQFFHKTLLNVHQWLSSNPRHSFAEWERKASVQQKYYTSLKDQNSVHIFYLEEKYFTKWYNRAFRISTPTTFEAKKMTWLREILFNPCSKTARDSVCNIINNFSQISHFKWKILDLLMSYLGDFSHAGENGSEFYSLFVALTRDSASKKYLASCGILQLLAQLLTREITHLHNLEKVVSSCDLSQGHALQQITSLLLSFMDNVEIKQRFKKSLVSDVLNGYLSLKRLVLQRTRLIDVTQEKLLSLLNQITTGTESETRNFMAICIETVDRCSPLDLQTPVFLFERLCSLVYPDDDDNKTQEFTLTIEKDPQQEDFLQGRMLGNPYPRRDPDLGPLMRDIKNKICRDCELVALLEDDNSMELLVHNRIISLSLPVVDVYKNVWLMYNGDPKSMHVVYRMRGLLGDATEEFIETFNTNNDNEIDPEVVYAFANVIDEYNGLQVMLNRLKLIDNVTRTKKLMQVLLKLFELCVKVERNRRSLCDPKKKAVAILLQKLRSLLLRNQNAPNENEAESVAALAEPLLGVLDVILLTAGTNLSIDEFREFSATFGSTDSIESFFSYMPYVRPQLLDRFMRVLAALVYCNTDKMRMLTDFFRCCLDFDQIDEFSAMIDAPALELFCTLTRVIHKNRVGDSLKDYIVSSLDLITSSVGYIHKYMPLSNANSDLTKLDSEEFKLFLSRPALQYVLKILAGLCDGTEHIQKKVAASNIIEILHKMEQVSSEVNVGILSENLLESLKQCSEVAATIEEVRERTKSEKKKLAMAVREKQLGALGMSSNEKGQVTFQGMLMQQIDDLSDETGLVCCICREGYKYHPAKVLGVYTFTKKTVIEPYEIKPRKTSGYSTVSHFNVIHWDCHTNAVRLARTRDEWESAALQNANTKCNGLLPFWGASVPESAFAFCLARHNNYLQEATGQKDISTMSTIHDLKLLFLRFAYEKSFNDDCGGGGPQSNIHLIPYIIHLALYVLNTTQTAAMERKLLVSYLGQTSTERWIESAHDVNGPLFWVTMSLLLHSRKQWQTNRFMHLKRLLVMSHVRHLSPTTQCKTLSSKEVQPFASYKPVLILFGLIDAFYYRVFKKVTEDDEKWPVALAEYIRNNDEEIGKNCEKLLEFYNEELLPCCSFDEFCDVCGLLNDISHPDVYINCLLLGM